MLSSSAAMGMGGYHQHQPQRPVFTAAQWAELEQQALIYKYLMAGVPVPSELLLPIRPHSAAASFNFANPAASPFYHHHHPSSKLPSRPHLHFTYLSAVENLADMDAHDPVGHLKKSYLSWEMVFLCLMGSICCCAGGFIYR
jgi:hypothetical protein